MTKTHGQITRDHVARCFVVYYIKIHALLDFLHACLKT